MVRENNTASRYYVNGNLVGEVGHPDTSKSLNRACWKPSIIEFSSPTDTVNILIHVSNYEFRNGGLGRPIKIGSIGTIQSIFDRTTRRDIMFLGIYLALALYHLAISILRRHDRTAMLLTTVYLSWILRTLFSTNFVIFEFIEYIPWSFQIRMEYLSLYLVIYTTSLYFMRQFDAYLFRFAQKILTTITIFFMLVLLIPDTHLISHLTTFYIYWLIPLSIVLFSAVARAALAGEKEGQIIFLGALVLAIAVLNDTLFTLGVISSGFIAPYMIVLFLVGQAFLVARQYANAFSSLAVREVELKQEIGLRITAEQDLLKHQLKLEETVSLRTSELHTVNEQLVVEIDHKQRKELELEKLNQTKDRFFSIIAHDLRGPIGTQMQYLELINQEFSEFSLEDLRETFFNLEKTSKKVYALLENLLTWSRL